MLCRDEEYILLLDIVGILSQHGRVALLCGPGFGVVGPFIFVFLLWLKLRISFSTG